VDVARREHQQLLTGTHGKQGGRAVRRPTVTNMCVRTC
jgi:hypothetical protein